MPIFGASVDASRNRGKGTGTPRRPGLCPVASRQFRYSSPARCCCVALPPEQFFEKQLPMKDASRMSGKGLASQVGNLQGT